MLREILAPPDPGKHRHFMSFFVSSGQSLKTVTHRSMGMPAAGSHPHLVSRDGLWQRSYVASALSTKGWAMQGGRHNRGTRDGRATFFLSGSVLPVLAVKKGSLLGKAWCPTCRSNGRRPIARKSPVSVISVLLAVEKGHLLGMALCLTGRSDGWRPVAGRSRRHLLR